MLGRTRKQARKLMKSQEKLNKEQLKQQRMETARMKREQAQENLDYLRQKNAYYARERELERREKELAKRESLLNKQEDNIIKQQKIVEVTTTKEEVEDVVESDSGNTEVKPVELTYGQCFWVYLFLSFITFMGIGFTESIFLVGLFLFFFICTLMMLLAWFVNLFSKKDDK